MGGAVSQANRLDPVLVLHHPVASGENGQVRIRARASPEGIKQYDEFRVGLPKDLGQGNQAACGEDTVPGFCLKSIARLWLFAL